MYVLPPILCSFGGIVFGPFYFICGNLLARQCVLSLLPTMLPTMLPIMLPAMLPTITTMFSLLSTASCNVLPFRYYLRYPFTVLLSCRLVFRHFYFLCCPCSLPLLIRRCSVGCPLVPYYSVYVDVLFPPCCPLVALFARLWTRHFYLLTIQ
jgi:hypothetical protein